MALPATASDPQSDALDKMFASARQASSLLKSLSHESRLLILCILSGGEKTVTELESMLALRQPTVSQQLSRLRIDGLVETRREGKAIYYRLASEDVKRVISVLYDIYCAVPATEETAD
ncbi:metalloregulator ArsR/SmtB family transcription factor [Microbaculum sp. FT89]|uniref:metalloregulator ArsR/SmtB family transcription factor n=1 Tax=Microbaculum sp. FT89 TaxID=3447298 RepID=UPI003F5324BC